MSEFVTVYVTYDGLEIVLPAELLSAESREILEWAAQYEAKPTRGAIATKIERT